MDFPEDMVEKLRREERDEFGLVSDAYASEEFISA